MTNPEFTQSGVLLPTALAVAMMECYFGQGPRFREKTSPSTNGTVDPAEVYRQVVERDPDGGGAERFARVFNSMREWVPRGAAATRAPTQVEGEVESPSP